MLLTITVAFLTSHDLFAQEDIRMIAETKYEKIDSQWIYVSESLDTIKVEPTKLVVRFTEHNIDMSKAKSAFGMADLEVLYGPTRKGYYVFRAPSDQRGFEVFERLMENSQVERIYFDSYGEFLSDPDDQYYSSQWNLEKIQMEETWEISKGNPDVLIAILDSGTDLDHEDLEHVIWSGTGWDFENNDNDPNPDNSVYHGTAVAGIAGAQTNNSTIGVAGVAGRWDSNTGARLMIYKVGTSNPSATATWMAIEEAVNEGADIINFSLSLAESPALIDVKDAIDYAVANDVVIIAASGNNGGGSSPNTSVLYPARFSNTIAVGASTENDIRWTTAGVLGSAFGSGLDLMAPSGYEVIWTTDIEGSDGFDNDDYFEFGMTSAAAPQVAGVAALMKAVDPSLTPAQIRSIFENSAEKVGPHSYTNGWNQYMGYGRLNAYEAVKAAIPQYSNHHFASTTTTYSYLDLSGSSTIAGGETLTIDDHHTVWVSGSLSSTGSSSGIIVKGRLILEANASLNDIELTVQDGAIFIAEDNTTVDAGITALTIAGEATLGDNFTLEAATKLEVSSTGRMEFTGDAALEFDERVMTFPGFPPIYGPGFVAIYGEVVSTHGTNEAITMDVAPGTTLGYWNGVTVYNSASGELRDVEIEGASIGVTTSSVSNLSLQDITVTAPTTTGFDINSSDLHAINLFVTGSDGTGMEVSGGAPEFSYFEVTDSDQSGVVISSYADAYTEDGHVSGSGGGGSNAGVWTSNATYTHINGSVGSNSGWDAAAVNNASVWFNGTSWSGSPYTYKDGSSTLLIQNQNNPVKAIAQQTTSEETQLLAEWSQRRRDDPEGAAGWLESTRSSLSDKLQGVAGILLADYHLARGNIGQAKALIGDLPQQVKSAQSPGALARRTLQIALNGESDRELAIQSLHELEQAGLRPALLDHYRHMARQRYGYDMDRKGVSPKEQEASEERLEVEVSAYPNPFNPVTNIEYTLPGRMKVSLAVYDLLGRQVAVLVNTEQSAGAYEVPFDAMRLSSGIYIYRLTAGTQVFTGQMTLIK